MRPLLLPSFNRSILLLALSLALLGGCAPAPDAGDAAAGDASSEARRFLSVGTAPAGGAFFVVGGALAEVASQVRDSWQVTGEATKGSRENIRRLAAGDLDFALSNAAITYFAVRGEAGWEQAYAMRSVMTLAPNIALFVAPASANVNTIADLRGKRVVIGPAGAGFEMFVQPILEAHGLSYDDMTVLNNTQSGAVDMLADGNADAAFLGGAVPTASITQAAASMALTYVPFDPAARQQLIDRYPFFHPATVPAGTYRGLDADFDALNVGSMHLITAEGTDEALVYDFTRAIYENASAVVQRHPAGKAINARNAPRDVGTPLHPGAQRFFDELAAADAAAATGAGDAPAATEAAAEAP
ncbi:MAG: TAXI family TRAP transporter solute-binding subunit [Acidobacteriota bacterium]